MLLIQPPNPRRDSQKKLDAQRDRIRELSKTRLTWNILIAALPIGIWLSSLVIRSAFELEGFSSSAVSIGTLVLQLSALTVTILMHSRYAKKLEQARTELLNLTLEHGRISLEESRENDAA